MKRLTVRSRAVIGATAFSLVSVLRLTAQTTAPDTGQATSQDDTIVLSPFVVDASEDAGGYSAKSTLAGTRVRTDLKDIASSISVVTKQFMQDTGAVDNQTLLKYTTNTEVGGVYGNFSGNAGGLQFSEDASLLRPNQNTRVRGLESADNTRDYFLTEIPWDGYNVDRVDMQRGPNSILFGVGSPAGIINTSINTATFKNHNSVENRVGSFGSVRFSADFNLVLLPNELAVRVAALDNNQKYRQDPAFNHDKRLFGAVRWAPKLFGEGSNTLVRANYEVGNIKANRPRTLPPVDAITPWFNASADSKGNLPLNKFTYDASKVDPGAAPFNADNRTIYPYAWLYNGSVGRQFWLDVVGYYADPNSSDVAFFKQPAGSSRNGIGPNGAIDGSINGLFGARAVGVANFSSYMIASGIPGGGYYSDRSLADSSIFDFYNKLIDGNNKYERQKWKAGNLSVSQTFFHDRLGFEAVYDWQRYKEEQRVFVGNSDTYKIGVDMVSVFHDGSKNPNVGRAYVANSDEQANHSYDSDRDSWRFTGNGELRASDFLDEKSRLARWLGRHVLTGLVSQDKQIQRRRDWATSAADPAYTLFTGENNSLTAHFRSYDYVAYLGPDMRGLSSASGVNLSSVNGTVKAPRSGQVWVFDNHWAKPTDPTANGYVDPSAPYSFTVVNAGLANGPDQQVVTTTQSENPANYGGWKYMNVPFLNADSGDIDRLTFNSTRSRYILDTQAFTWQGYMFDEVLVPTFGWRKDKIKNRAGSGVPDSWGIVSNGFELNPEGTSEEAESKSWGAVLHLPRKWTDRLPGKTDISFHYFRGQNFRAGAPRGDVFGNAIPNASGKTKDYGIVINTLDDKLTLKVTRYETTVQNATLSGSNPLGQNSYFLWAVPVWGTAFVVNADQGLKGNNDNNSWAWNYASSDDANAPQFRNPDGSLNPAWQSHPSTVKEKAAIDAWRQLPVGQTFFNAYGNEVALLNSDAIKAGNWTAADPIWNQKFDNQPVSGGQLATFGSAPVFSVDTLSKGTEIEIIAQPTKNWNIAVNASKTFASINALAPTIEAYIQDMTDFLAGPAGDIRLWGSGANPLRGEWKNNILNPYATFKSQVGKQQPEIAPWRVNVISTYNFDHGKLKGAFVGGSWRYEAARVLGYKYDPAKDVLDINAPWKGDSDQHYDLWVGYSRKLTSRINWRTQLNLSNVGESKGLEPLSINPDGTTAYSRITEGMTWQLTNTFEF